MSTATVHYEQGKLRQEIVVGRHHLVADEPVANGGEDAGPNPFDYLATALGACTALTLRMYSQHKQWPLENAVVTVKLDKTDAGVLFDRALELVGPLDEAQRTRLLRVAESCPVHKVLTGKIEIRTRLV
jgi:putative redox protein